jgi:hypothetical protein
MCPITTMVVVGIMVLLPNLFLKLATLLGLIRALANGYEVTAVNFGFQGTKVQLSPRRGPSQRRTRRRSQRRQKH